MGNFFKNNMKKVKGEDNEKAEVKSSFATRHLLNSVSCYFVIPSLMAKLLGALSFSFQKKKEKKLQCRGESYRFSG